MSNQAANAGRATPSERGRRPSHEATVDVVLTVLLVALFAWAYLETTQWSFRAALFPRIVTGLSLTLSALHLVQALWRLRGRARRTPRPSPIASQSGHNVEPDDEEDIFRTADGRIWASALGWVAMFFVLLYVGGLFITAPLFSFLYLRFPGRRKWVFSTIYAAVIGAVLYFVFELMLGVSTPSGLFFN